MHNSACSWGMVAGHTPFVATVPLATQGMHTAARDADGVQVDILHKDNVARSASSVPAYCRILSGVISMGRTAAGNKVDPIWAGYTGWRAGVCPRVRQALVTTVDVVVVVVVVDGVEEGLFASKGVG